MNFVAHRIAAWSSVVFLGSITMAAQSPAPVPTAPASNRSSEANLARSQSSSEKPSVRLNFQAPPDRVANLESWMPDYPADAGCPVAVHAEHGSGAGLVITRERRFGTVSPQTSSQVPAQRIRLVLGRSGDRTAVIAARVTVSGTDGSIRTVPALDRDGSPSATKTVDLTFEATGDGGVSTDMLLPGFASVQSIRLESLTYADGSLWSQLPGRSCRVAPDPFMLVSAR